MNACLLPTLFSAHSFGKAKGEEKRRVCAMKEDRSWSTACQDEELYLTSLSLAPPCTLQLVFLPSKTECGEVGRESEKRKERRAQIGLNVEERKEGSEGGRSPAKHLLV